MNNKAIELIKEALELLMPKEVKLTLSEIMADGQDRIGKAIEVVISKHEKEIDAKATDRRKINEHLGLSNQEMKIIRERNYLAGLAAMAKREPDYLDRGVCSYSQQGSARGLLGGWS